MVFTPLHAILHGPYMVFTCHFTWVLTWFIHGLYMRFYMKILADYMVYTWNLHDNICFLQAFLHAFLQHWQKLVHGAPM